MPYTYLCMTFALFVQQLCPPLLFPFSLFITSFIVPSCLPPTLSSSVSSDFQPAYTLSLRSCLPRSTLSSHLQTGIAGALQNAGAVLPVCACLCVYVRAWLHSCRVVQCRAQLKLQFQRMSEDCRETGCRCFSPAWPGKLLRAAAAAAAVALDCDCLWPLPPLSPLFHWIR